MSKDRYIFRGKRLNDDQWVYGNLYTSDNGTYIGRDKNAALAWMTELLIADHFFEVDPATVGQCLGLKDKKYKAIFEGDIIKVDCSSAWNNILLTGAVFVDADFCAKVQYWDDCERELAECPFSKLVGYYHTIYEVLGNIHDNPELMGGVIKIGTVNTI